MNKRFYKFITSYNMKGDISENIISCDLSHSHSQLAHKDVFQ